MSDAAPAEQQATRHLLMIRPAGFSGNAQTAASNRFQDVETGQWPADPQAAAVAEFDAFVDSLRTSGTRIIAVEDSNEPTTPDALFPNNWVSFHADGTAVLYPMLAPNRRLERRMDILESLVTVHGFRIDRVIDLTYGEQEGRFLEGTGSLVLDRLNRVAYSCLSPRTDPGLLNEFGRRLGYEVIPFSATDGDGHPVYHTNVMLSVGERFAAICTDSIRPTDRWSVLDKLQSTGHRLIELSRAQMSRFAGNMLEVRGAGDRPLVAVSAAGFDALTEAQARVFAALGLGFVVARLPTIERLGGGSARCMLAEIHLPSNPVRVVRERG